MEPAVDAERHRTGQEQSLLLRSLQSVYFPSVQPRMDTRVRDTRHMILDTIMNEYMVPRRRVPSLICRVEFLICGVVSYLLRGSGRSI